LRVCKAYTRSLPRGQYRFHYSRAAHYYGRNQSEHKELIEKLKYIHRNSVNRKLVETPEEWKWNSYRHYASGEDSEVQIESWSNKTYFFNPPAM
jgi:hypothetical protein